MFLLVIAYDAGEDSELAYYDETLSPLMDIVELEGNPIGVYLHDGTVAAITYSATDRLKITTVVY